MSSIILSDNSLISEVSWGYTNVAILSNTRCVIIYRLNSDSKTYVIVGTIASNNSITFGTPVEITSSNQHYQQIIKLTSSSFVVKYGKYCRVCTINESDEVTLGTEKEIDPNAIVDSGIFERITDSSFIVGYSKTGGYPEKETYYCVVGTVSGTTISLGTPLGYKQFKIYTAYVDEPAVRRISDTKLLLSYILREPNKPMSGQTTRSVTSLIVNIDGTNLSDNSETVARTGVYNLSEIDAQILNSSSFLIAYTNPASSSQQGKIKIGTINESDEISFGTEYEFSNNLTRSSTLNVFDENNFFVAWTDDNIGKGSVGTISSGVISFGSVIGWCTEEYTRDTRINKIDSEKFTIFFTERTGPTLGVYKSYIKVGTFIASSFIPRTMWFN